MYPLSVRPFLNLSFLAASRWATQPYSALSTTMLWIRTVKNKESSTAWTETMSPSPTCFRKLFLSSILSQWQSLHLESETAIFPTSWSCHSTLNQALIVLSYQDARVVCYLLMFPGLCTVQATHIKWYFSLCKTVMQFSSWPSMLTMEESQLRTGSVLYIFSFMTASSYRLEELSLRP